MIREMLNLMAPMRDGTLLACNVYRLDDDKPYPAILLRTPYIKEKIDSEDIYANYRELAAGGYNMVFQDVRGTGMSQGVLDATGASEPDDGYDSVEWIAAQGWCDGNVGMQGLSYFGFTQMAAAEGNSPHLKALCPFQNSAVMPFSASKAGTIGNYHLVWVYERVLEHLERWYPNGQQRAAIREKIEQHQAHFQQEMLHLPLRDTAALQVEDVPQLKSFLELLDGVEDPGFMARAHRPVRIEDISAPMFFLTDWFDGARDGTIDNWNRAALGRAPAQNCRLIIGPWLHGGKLSAQIDGRDFGEANSGAGIGVQDLVKRWFDYWLKGQDSGIMAENRVLVFVLGANTWRPLEEWPPSRIGRICWFTPAGPWPRRWR